MRKSELQREYGVVHVRYLDGLSEAIDYMDHAEEQQKMSKMEAASLSSDHSEWYGTVNMKQAIEVARYGWEEGREYLRGAVGRVALDSLIGRRHAVNPVLSYAGDEVDIGTFLYGDPEHMINYPLYYDKQGKQATMLVNFSISSDVSAERIMRRGAALYAAMEVLRADGYSLGLTMVDACTPSGYSDDIVGVEYQIPIIQPGQYLDIDTAAFCLAHPSFLRRLNFAISEHEPEEIRRVMGYTKGGDYGKPCRIFSPIPPHSFLIDEGDGLDLGSDEQVEAFAQQVVDRTIEVLHAELANQD